MTLSKNKTLNYQTHDWAISVFLVFLLLTARRKSEHTFTITYQPLDHHKQAKAWYIVAPDFLENTNTPMSTHYILLLTQTEKRKICLQGTLCTEDGCQTNFPYKPIHKNTNSNNLSANIRITENGYYQQKNPNLLSMLTCAMSFHCPYPGKTHHTWSYPISRLSPPPPPPSEVILLLLIRYNLRENQVL